MLRTFHEDPQQLFLAYFHCNRVSPRSLAIFAPRLFRATLEFGYLGWPRKIAADLHGRHVLDVGCGQGLHGVGSLFVGARSYTGVDASLDPSDHGVKDKRGGTSRPFPWTPRQIERRLLGFRLLAQALEDGLPEAEYDLVVLHNSTEHVASVEQAFEACRDRLRPGGRIIFNHHNYAAWNGHHMAPKFVSRIDLTDSRQQQLVDWGHLSPAMMRDEALSRIVNRIRLDDLRALTVRFFEIETWDERPSDRERGGERLTQAVLRRYPEYSERELRTQGVFCRAIRRG